MDICFRECASEIIDSKTPSVFCPYTNTETETHKHRQNQMTCKYFRMRRVYSPYSSVLNNYFKNI